MMSLWVLRWAEGELANLKAQRAGIELSTDGDLQVRNHNGGGPSSEEVLCTVRPHAHTRCSKLLQGQA